MGVFESEKFAGGTLAVARAIAELTEGGAMSVVAGGETVRTRETFRSIIYIM